MSEEKKKTEKKVESKRGEAAEYAEAFADDRGITVNEAMAHLAVIGWNRVKALKKDWKRRAKGIKPQHRKVTVQVLGPSKAKASKPKKTKKVKKVKVKKAKAHPANGAVHPPIST